MAVTNESRHVAGIGTLLFLNILNFLCVTLFTYFTITNMSILAVVKAYILVSVSVQSLIMVSLLRCWPQKGWNIMEGILCWIGSSFLFHIIAVLYGAPLVSSVPQTSHLAMLLSTTAVFPGLVVLGTKKEEWIRLFFKTSPANALEASILISSVCSILGGWLGAFPIPLDWDRPWQVWPISCVIGTLAGYGFGLILASCVLIHKHLKSSKSKYF